MRGNVDREQVVIDGVVFDLVDPAVCTPVPERDDALRDPDAAAAAAAVVPPSGTVLGAVTALRADRLSGTGLIDAAVACERLKQAVDAKQAEFLAQLATRDPQGAEFLTDEVACALHLAPGTAAERVRTAVAITGRLWDCYDRMGRGDLPHSHARILATATADLPDTAALQVQEAVVARGAGQTPGEFRSAVRRAVARVDRKNQAERHADAVAERRVVHEPAPDGMAWLNLFLPADGAAIMMGALNAWAVKTGPQDERSLDHPPQAGGTPSRADAAVELALAGLATPGLPAAHGLKPVINITLAASTLSGADEQPGQINGQPVPAQVARHWAAHPDATWRYWSVDHHGQIQDSDPTGHDLATGSYTPTPRIARHVTFRDHPPPATPPLAGVPPFLRLPGLPPGRRTLPTRPPHPLADRPHSSPEPPNPLQTP